MHLIIDVERCSVWFGRAEWSIGRERHPGDGRQFVRRMYPSLVVDWYQIPKPKNSGLVSERFLSLIVLLKSQKIIDLRSTDSTFSFFTFLLIPYVIL